MPRIARAAGLSLLLLASGCLQIETRVKLHPDGSATITERVQLSKRLLDLSSQEGLAANIGSMLTKQETLKRMQHMGKGMRLVSHKVREAEKGGKESISVFKIQDINEFQYVSPYLGMDKYPKHTALKCKLFPIDRRAHGGWAWLPGQMGVSFYPATREPRRGRPKDWKPPKPPSPRDSQVLRDLRPVFRDLMKDFQLKLTFESYAPLRFRPYYRFRGQRAATKCFDLIDFSDKDLDKYGYAFLGNEEIMLELLRLQTGKHNVVENVKGHAGNLTVPVFHPFGAPEIYFNPSRIFFEKFFQGKTLHFYKKEGGPRPARWKDIGWKEDPYNKKK